jgi:hypothetical protein
MEEKQRYFLVALGDDKYIVAERARQYPTELLAVTETITGATWAADVIQDLTLNDGIICKLSKHTRYHLRRRP